MISSLRGIGNEIRSSISHNGYLNVLNRLGSRGEGIEKTSRVALVFFSILSTLSEQSAQKFLPARAAMQEAVDCLFALTSLHSFAKLTRQAGHEELNRYNLTSALLLAIGGVCESLYFMVKTGILDKDTFSSLGQTLGEYSVFQYQPFNSLLARPSQFFILLGSLVSSIERFAFIRKERIMAAKKDLDLPKYFGARDLLLHIGNGGKVLLAFSYPTLPTRGYLLAIDAVTRSSDIILYAMKA